MSARDDYPALANVRSGGTRLPDVVAAVDAALDEIDRLRAALRTALDLIGDIADAVDGARTHIREMAAGRAG